MYPEILPKSTSTVDKLLVNGPFSDPESDQVPAVRRGKFNHASVRYADVKASVSKNAAKAWESIKSGAKKFPQFVINLAKDVHTFVSKAAMKTAAYSFAGILGGFLAGGVIGLCTVPPAAIVTAPTGAVIGFGAGASAGAIYGCHQGWKAVKQRRANMRQQQVDAARQTEQKTEFELSEKIQESQPVVDEQPTNSGKSD